ncbi:MAG TPA: hypothetical protein VH877_09105 [Polyangia bacterium]|jgi:hypothetical protein|nr:hypothetical protein [Polyangia bacterium]
MTSTSPAKSRPPLLTILAALTVLVGSLGVGHGLTRLLSYAEGRDAFVEQARDAFTTQLPHLPAEERQRLAEDYGERAWARGGAVVPLALVNLILSFLLFSGAIETLRGRRWGASAWEWSAKLSIPYSVVAMVLLRMEFHDLGPGLSTIVKAAAPSDGQAAAETEALARGVTALYGLVTVAFYLACVLYLQRPKVRALFPEEPTMEQEEEG